MSFRGHVPEGKVQQFQRRAAELYGDPSAQDVGQGLAKGAASLGKGLFAGLGTLVATPVAGIAQEGGVGFFKGLAAGVVGAGVIFGTGVVIAARQVGSGIVNTPETVRRMMDLDKSELAAAGADLLDDAEVREVNTRTYAASRAVVEAFAFGEPVVASDTGASGLYQGTPAPKETGLYELLGVGPTAAQNDIRDSFFKLTQGSADQESQARLAELAEACQILMDPRARKKYDEEGRGSLGSLPTLEAPIFHTMLFGAEPFKPLVGEFFVAHVAGGGASLGQSREWQAQREASLAQQMLTRLHPWLQGHHDVFVMETLALLVELKKEPFAVPLAECIGYTYYHMAEVSLDIESSLDVPQHLKAGLMLDELSDENKPVPEGASAPAFLDSLWLINAVDLESTLRQVVEILVTDKEVPEAERRQRACGILKFGKVFMEI